MKVKIIQAHKTYDNGIWTEYHVGQEIEIDMALYSPNLHEKLDVKVRRSKPYIDDDPGRPELGEDSEAHQKTAKAGGLAPKDKEK